MVRRANLDYQFAVLCITRARCRGVPQPASQTLPSKLRQKKRSELTGMRHRSEQRRPQVEALKSNDTSRRIDGHVNRLARRERLQVAPFLLYRPRPIDRGIDPFL